MFSLSGFTQKSYEKIHGLNLKNIEQIVLPFQEVDMMDKVEVNFHVYQFNLGELHLCSEFCNNLGIRFVPRYAFLADWDLFNNYLQDNLSSKELKEISKELFLHYYDNLLEEKPVDYKCPQSERLFINSCGEVLPCATSTEDILGHIFTMSYDDIVEKKNHYYRCEECMKTGQAYIIQQYTQFLSEYDETAGTGIHYYGNTLSPVIYYSTDNSGFCESKKVMTSCMVRNNGGFVAKFSLGKNYNIKQVRFDPCEYPCSLSELTILCDERKIDYYPYNGVICDNGTIKFETSDPCIIANIDTLVEEIIVKGIIN